MSARKLVLCIAILIPAHICTSSSRGRTLAANSATYITHVTVIDTETGAENPDQTVIVAGDRITAVRASSSEQPVAGAQVIDGSGKFLIPGLWDMHVHGAASCGTDSDATAGADKTVTSAASVGDSGFSGFSVTSPNAATWNYQFHYVADTGW